MCGCCLLMAAMCATDIHIRLCKSVAGPKEIFKWATVNRGDTPSLLLTYSFFVASPAYLTSTSANGQAQQLIHKKKGSRSTVQTRLANRIQACLSSRLAG